MKMKTDELFKLFTECELTSINAKLIKGGELVSFYREICTEGSHTQKDYDSGMSVAYSDD